jgi:Spy/CpxP family protein refolding chaperone
MAGGVAQAEEPFKVSVSLSMDQAKQIDDIQKKYRKPFAAKRQELNKELRALRRAKLANDSAALARQEKVTAKLRDELRAIRAKENDELRAALTPEQRAAFEQVIERQQETYGGSDNERETFPIVFSKSRITRD